MALSRYLNNHLGAKLLLSYLTVVLIAILVLALASQWILPTALNRHMQGMGTMMGGSSGPGMMQGLFSDFRSSFNEALLFSGVVGLITAVVSSIILSRRVLAPLNALMQASRSLSEGRYEERVLVQSGDELGQLASRFNLMAERLQQVESMRRMLIADVSHELRTPLTAIGGSMEGLIDGVLPATEETYEQIRGETERLSRLVDDLQELSRVEARAYELKIRPLEIPDLVRTVINRVAPQLESGHIALELSLPGSLPRVLADEDRAIQVLTNLVANAAQYSAEGGRVLISAAASRGAVRVLVQDEGVGIPPEHLPHIFDRFYRVDKSRSRRAGGGSGIGLTIAKYLVEAMQGRIWAESGGESQGSTFGFTLPSEA